MDSFTTLLTFNYPSEAYVLRSLLESEGIRCFLKDELNVQIYSLSSNAYGGVKLQVPTSELDHATEILKANGYGTQTSYKTPSFWAKFDNITGRVPYLKQYALVYRFLIVAAILIFLLIVVIMKLAE